MLPHLPLHDSEFLTALLLEFRRSMRGLFVDLCDELETLYGGQTKLLRLPVRYFRFLGDRLRGEDYAGWKIVGWIEEINDLVYFMDLRAQLRRERDPAEFAEALFLECERQFYENSYLDDLFPRGRPEAAGLPGRLQTLCAHLARQVTQESLLLVPGLSCVWLAQTGGSQWTVPADLRANFERAELPGRLYFGLVGACLEPSVSIRQALVRQDWQARLQIRRQGMGLQVGRRVIPFLTCRGGESQHLWREVPPCIISPANAEGHEGVTLGSTLVYGRDRTPRSVVASSPDLVERLQTALAVIRDAWPAGAKLLATLTSRLVPLRARGVVSFSYRHRPGLSFINLSDRDQLDLIDDLVHENSHHHLNLLLRKYRLFDDDRTEEIFYSPWRRSLRPLRGILHATFTFTMGALLFDRLSAWGASGTRRAASGKAALTDQQLLRARFRCLEEIDSVRYSLRDLDYAGQELGWMSAAGKSLVDSLRREMDRVRKRIAPYVRVVLRSRQGAELRRHRRELVKARKTYGPRRSYENSS